MTTATSVFDLVDSARRRARLAAVLGHLLAEEPRHELGELVATVPELAALAEPDPTLAAAFERILIREVPLHESVFTGPDGRRGGPTVATLSGFYDRHELGAPPPWRVAGPDHLAIELWAYGALCAEEAAGWEERRPDRATRAVEAEREFLMGHLGVWAEVAVTALARRAIGTPYAALADAVGSFVAEEVERLRPTPDHPGLPPVEVAPAPQRAGPAALARWLLAPGRCGAYLGVDDLANAANALGIPWRPSDPRSRFREVIEGATDGGDLPALAAALKLPIQEWRDAHAHNEAEREGNRRVWRAWRMRAEESLRLLDRVESAGRARSGESRPEGELSSVVVRVLGPGEREREHAAAAVVGRLRALEVAVGVCSHLPAQLHRATDTLLDAGADTVLLASDTSTAVAWRDGGPRGDREQRFLADAAVIVRLEPAAGATRVEVDAHGERGLRDHVVEALAGLEMLVDGAESTRTTP
ncbi:MAG: molecular chaperone TorD family protein [Acidimicrobiia bacterium]